LLQLAVHTREIFPCLIVDLVSIVVHQGATQTVLDVLANQPQVLGDDQLKLLAHQLADSLGDDQFVLRIDGERMMIDDLLQRLYSDDGNGDGHLTPAGLAAIKHYELPVPEREVWLFGPFLSAAVAGRREMRDLARHWFDRWEAERRQPLWQWAPSSAEAEMKQKVSRLSTKLRYFPLLLLIPALDGAFVAAETRQQLQDAALTAIALELHRRRTDEWPSSLAELTPTLLPTLPIDRFTGEPLRYRLVEGDPLLYSCGTDGDDDGGRVPVEGNDSAHLWRENAKLDATTISTQWAATHDGDWILWPPVDGRLPPHEASN
jgi:hypothetical protein